MKNLAILGSTGSIGVNALNVVSAHPERYRVLALSAGRNTALLKKQIEIFRPKAVALLNESLATDLEKALVGKDLPRFFLVPKVLAVWQQ